MAVEIATRWGFTESDARTIGHLVRWHLMLPNIATRRDIEDPSTAANVAEIVETNTKRRTPRRFAASSSARVPSTFTARTTRSSATLIPLLLFA